MARFCSAIVYMSPAFLSLTKRIAGVTVSFRLMTKFPSASQDNQKATPNPNNRYWGGLFDIIIALTMIHLGGTFLARHTGLLPFSSLRVWLGASACTVLIALLIHLSFGRCRGYFAGILTYNITLFLFVSWFIRFRLNRFLTPRDFSLIKYLFEDYSRAVAIQHDLLMFVALSLALAGAVTWFIHRNASSSCQSCFLFVGLALIIPLSVIFWRGEEVFYLRRTLPEAALLSYLRPEPSFPAIKSRPDSSTAPLVPRIHQVDIQRQPNVLLIVVEALRRDVIGLNDRDGQSYTPFLSSLANSGFAYPLAYAQAADSELSLHAVISSQYPMQNDRRPSGVPHSHFLSVAHTLGYRNAFLTAFEWTTISAALKDVTLFSDPTMDGGALKLREKIQSALGKTPDNQDIIFQLDALNVERLTSWIEQDRDTPFAALINLYGTHFPYGARLAKIADTYYFNYQDRLLVKSEYLAATRRADELIRRLDELLQRQNRPYVLVVTGDHGEEFYEHGGYLHAAALSAEVMNVPLLIRGLPDRCIAPQTTRSAVGHIDILPTLFDVWGLPVDFGHQGKSLCQQLTRRPLFASSRALRNQDAVISDDYKYVSDLDGFPMEVFDLTADSKERSNLAPNIPLARKRGGCLISGYRHFQTEQDSSKSLGMKLPPQYDNQFYELVERCISEN